MPRVVNLRKEKCTKRIDRSTGFGNPFSIGPDGDRDEVCNMHQAWLEDWIVYGREIIVNGKSNKWVIEHLSELKDEVVGCFCKPLRCHGDFLVILVDRM